MHASGYAVRRDTVIGHVVLRFPVVRHFPLGCCFHILYG